jgi:putative ABC transport system substrate-binding protein
MPLAPYLRTGLRPSRRPDRRARYPFPGIAPMSRRRAGLTIAALALAILLPPPGSQAQPRGKIPRIGVLYAAVGRDSALHEAFLQGLRERGWIDGRNISVELRSAAGKYDRLPALAEELVRLKVDIIFAPAAVAIKPVRLATDTIPIVMVAVDYDPVAAGLIESIAKPGANVTGLFLRQLELSGKRLELLKEAVRGISRVVVVFDSVGKNQLPDTESAARALHIQLHAVEVRDQVDLDNALKAASGARLGAVIVLASPFLYLQQSRIADFALKNRLATMASFSEFAEGGGLMSYGARLPDMFRHAATYVDKLLRGARPADLPVEQPTPFQLVINLKTAKAIGLTIPQSVLIRADQVIQ